MAKQAESTRFANLRFDIDLECQLNEKPFIIRSLDRQIVVEVPDMATGRELLQLGSPQESMCTRLNQWKGYIDVFAVNIVLLVAGTKIAEMKAGNSSSMLKFFGIPPLHVKLLTAIRLIFWKR